MYYNHKCTTYIATIAEVVWIEQDSLTEPIPIQIGFEFSFLLRDWLPPQHKRAQSTLGGGRWICIFSNGINTKQIKQNQVGIDNCNIIHAFLVIYIGFCSIVFVVIWNLDKVFFFLFLHQVNDLLVFLYIFNDWDYYSIHDFIQIW